MTTQQSHAPDGQTCLSEDVILAFQRGETTDGEREHIHQHVDVCDHCRGLVLLAARLDDVTEDGGVADDSSERLSAFMTGCFPWRTFADGKRLAKRFDILRFVERGGMGEVYEAFDSVLGSRVALKTLLVTTADNSQAIDRLSQEVNLARRVAHLNVCRIYDLHEHHEPGQRPMRFLAMEFVKGETLKDRLLASELTVMEACAVARQLLQGLGAIHGAGVLHLDFKSQNVMLRSGTEPAQAVVTDFSLSRAFEKELRLRTSERQLAGSVGYMSPEQLECQATLGPASDVYSFGVVLFEMLTRRMPFEGESPTSIMLKQLKSTPAPPSSLRPEVGPALDQLVLVCLSRQPRARFQTVEAVLLELERCVRLQSAPAKPQPRWRRTALAAALAVSAIGSLAALGNSAKRQAATPLQGEAALRPAEHPGVSAAASGERALASASAASNLASTKASPDGASPGGGARPSTPASAAAKLTIAPSKAARSSSRAPKPLAAATGANDSKSSDTVLNDTPLKDTPLKDTPLKETAQEPVAAEPQPGGASEAAPEKANPAPERPKAWTPERAPDFLL